MGQRSSSEEAYAGKDGLLERASADDLFAIIIMRIVTIIIKLIKIITIIVTVSGMVQESPSEMAQEGTQRVC